MQAGGGGLQLLELAAPTGPVACGNSHLVRDGGSGIRHEATQVPIAHIGTDDHQALAVFSADLIRPQHRFQARHIGQGNELDAAFHRWQWNGQPRQHRRIAAQGFREADHQIEAAIALEERAGLASAERRGNHILDVADIEAVACGSLTIDLHTQQRQPTGLLHLHLGSAGDLLQHPGDVRSGLVQHRHVIAEDLDRHIAAHPGNQLVEPQLDRLRQLVIATGYTRSRCFQLSHQLLARLAWIRPLRLRLEHHIAVGDVRRHRIRGDLGGAGPREYPLHLGYLIQDGALQALLHIHRLPQAGTGHP